MVKPLSILIFSEPTYPHHPGGSGKCAHLFAAGMARRGLTVRVVCPGSSSLVETIDGVEVHRLPLAARPPVAGTRIEENAVSQGILNYIWNAIPLSEIDLILDMGGFLSYFFLVEYRLRKQLGVPVVVFFQFLEEHVARDPERFIYAFPHPSGLFPDQHKERSQCFAARLASAVVCPSAEEASLVERLFRKRHVYVLPNPVDPRLAAAPVDKSWKARLAPANETLVMFGGRIDDWTKGPDIVRDAFRIAAAKRSGLRLVLIGDSQDLHFWKPGSRVTRTGWIPDAETLASVLHACDLLLMPSRYEPFGMMCTEAMAMGRPVIASPVGGLRDIVVHGKSGILLDGANPSRWATQMAGWIVRLADAVPFRVALGQNAKLYTAQKFGADGLAVQLESICRDALERHARANGRALDPPELDASSQQQYLRVLRTLAGPMAESAGRQLLTTGVVRKDIRCLACSRYGIAKSAWRVASTTAKDRRLRTAALAACPVGLLRCKELESLTATSGLVSMPQLWRARIERFLDRFSPEN
jgi:glycosyltransferase involved in cell wall biosynthesis